MTRMLATLAAVSTLALSAAAFATPTANNPRTVAVRTAREVQPYALTGQPAHATKVITMSDRVGPRHMLRTVHRIVAAD